jgi:phosphatidylglycerol:prolipoprotein diacylglycerol transferase
VPSYFIDIGPIHTSFYTFIVIAAIIAGSAFVAVVMRQSAAPAQIVDVLLAGLAAGLLLGRFIHVLLNWVYFSVQREEIWHIDAGGLDWHGAFIGAMAAILVMARMRNLPRGRLLDALAIVLPLIALAAWWGCGAAHCAYGAEVDNLSHYPAWLVWEEADIYNIIAPRYATQLLGMIISAAILAVMLVITALNWLRGRRLWLALALVAIAMFVLGFTRGDYGLVVAGLRQDQWLDAAMTVCGIALLLAGWRVTERSSK